MKAVPRKRIYIKQRIPKGIGWYRTDETYRRGGRLKLNTYFQVLDNGLIQKVDIARGIIAHQRSFSAGVNLIPITKRTWNSAVTKLTKELQTKFNTYK
jgi:hypothetical protein